MNNLALQTLLHPFDSGFLSLSGRVLFLNAQFHPYFANIDTSQWVFQQFFKPYAHILEENGFQVFSDMPEIGDFDIVLLLAPKNKVEAQCMIGQGLDFLKTDGLLAVAAENKAGGGRLLQHFEAAGLDHVMSDSRNKSRVVWAHVDGHDEDFVSNAMAEGVMQGVLDDDFQSQPGIFGWDKIDRGSQILVEHLPPHPINSAKCGFRGHGADFGCGYGYLSRYVLKHYKPKSLHCLDADMRAVRACEMNVKAVARDTDLYFDWVDLANNKTSFNNLDFVVMNPPFHEGKKVDLSVGEGFIQNAAAALKRTSTLWIVANNRLAYEPILEQCFFKVDKVFEGQGFKVFKAGK